MARLTPEHISGAIGNLIFYKLNDRWYVRARPVRVKQTRSTKMAAKRFGRAKMISGVIRSGLIPVTGSPRSLQIMYAMDRGVMSWLQHADLAVSGRATVFQGIQLNEKTSLSARLKKELNVEWKENDEVVVKIPSLQVLPDIAAPSGTQNIELVLGISGAALKDGQMTTPTHKQILISYEDSILPARRIVLPFKRKPGSINVVVASLRYYKSSYERGMEIKKEQWQPIGVLDAYYMAG